MSLSITNIMEMNRIVLIGNGFDLAHGLKTKYEHFIKWYLNQKKDSTGILYKEKIKNYDMYVEHMNVRQIEESMRDPCIFLNNILKRIGSYGWVDIEKEYYTLLIQQIYPINDSSQRLDPMILNIQLDHLKAMLIEYLKIEDEKGVEVIHSIKDKIHRSIIRREIATTNLNSNNFSPDDVKPSNTMLLNFNYTKTAKQYTDSESNVKLNHIHGQLDDEKSIIFGYGDELDGDYEKLKNLNDNECLRNMKSIRYLEADNYRKMLEFIESAPFQVCIMGHSCGISDRTLLNTLFEHKNCISILPYYYIKEKGSDNYLELVQNISRNFTDMKLMRDRVVNKLYCESLV